MTPVRRFRPFVVVTVAVVVSAIAVLGLLGSPAGADPARPTNFRSRILSVEPALQGATVEIAGGDAFVVLTVERGHEAIVPDYGDGTNRPYLRFQADGTVQLNESSAAASANESRFGTSSARFDPDAEPRWRTVATDGSYAWHDHRVHLMVPDDMAVVDERGRVDLGGEEGTWQIPLSIDGTETVVEGELVRLDAPSAWPWYLAAAVAALVLVGGVVALGAGRWVVSVALAITSASAAYVAATELSEAPKGSGASSVPLIIAGAALLGALGTTIATGMGSRGQPVARISTALAAVTLLWWGATRIEVFANTILPSGLDAVDRTATAAALALGAAVAVLLVWRPGLLFGSGKTIEQDPT